MTWQYWGPIFLFKTDRLMVNLASMTLGYIDEEDKDDIELDFQELVRTLSNKKGHQD